MKVDSVYFELGGHRLHRLVMNPDDGVLVRAVMICYHGQGDYVERYADLLHVFTQRGIRCVATELPGHGYSSGKRGHCGDESMLDLVIKNTLDEYVRPDALSYGVMGHSMGGLLATRHIVLAGMGRLPALSFAWLSSPLVDPTNRRSAGFVKMVQIFALLLPAVTISTQVKAEDCRAQAKEEDSQDGPSKAIPSSPTLKEQLWHSRVSLGWGALLIQFAKFIKENSSSVVEGLPILVTQGSADPVCPLDHTRELFHSLASEEKELLVLDGVLHETFKSEGSELMFGALEKWLDGLFPLILATEYR